MKTSRYIVYFGMLFLTLSCGEKKVDGCNDSSSCTYNPDVTNYVHGSCSYLDDCGVCGGNNNSMDIRCSILSHRVKISQRCFPILK